MAAGVCSGVPWDGLSLVGCTARTRWNHASREAAGRVNVAVVAGAPVVPAVVPAVVPGARVLEGCVVAVVRGRWRTGAAACTAGWHSDSSRRAGG